MRTILNIFFFALILVATASIVIKNRKLYDNQNRQLTFHGTNVVVKVPPYIPSTGSYDPEWSFGLQDIQLLKKNGFNSVRLGMMWSGLQPKKDWYNETYLQQMVNIVNTAGEHGIFTLVDFHQDLLSQKFCGDGVPIWLMDQIKGYKTFPFPMGTPIKLNSTGLPSWQDCDQKNWGKYYFSYDVGQGFNNLYNLNHKLNHKFTQYWQKVAKAFKGNPYVIAYELINEPFIGNFWRNPALVIPSVAQRLKFQNFYDQLSLKIRQIDQQTPICFQPITFDNTISAGFSHPPGGKKYQNKSIFCYHYYKPPALGISTIDARVKDGKRLGIPSLLSQFGQWSDPLVFEKLQKYQQSWLYWEYKSFGKNWGSNENQVMKLNQFNKNFIRTYFPVLAGQMHSTNFNSSNSHFTAIFTANPSGKSILYANIQVQYPNGYLMSVIPQKDFKISFNEQNYFTIQFVGSQKKKAMITLSKL